MSTEELTSIENASPVEDPAIRRMQDGTFAPGFSGNPKGRPRNTLKDYLSRKFSGMSDGEKEAWLKANKVPGEIQWRMAEGNPKQDMGIDGELRSKVVSTDE